MLLAAYILISVCLMMIFIQDCRDRAVHFLYFIGLLIASIYFCYINKNIFINLYSSLLFLIANFSFLKIYMKLRGKVMPKELFFGGVAIGDVIFLVVIIPLFSFISYTIFYVSGMIFSLILHFFVVRFKLDKKETVPLAGYLSVFLLFIFCLDRILKINLFSTELFSL